MSEAVVVESRMAYVAGPMRGHHLHNFPKFDEVSDLLREMGWTVISPADLDREVGYDPSVPPTPQELMEMFERDLEAVDQVDTIVLLPGWEQSEGVGVELRHASRRTPRKPSLAIWVDVNKSIEEIEWTEAARKAGFGV